MNSSTSEQIFRGAIALNNIGVDLLERRCYQQASVTLLDATNAMKSVFGNSSSDMEVDGRPSPQGMSPAIVSGMLERANKRRSRPCPMERSSSFRMLKLDERHPLAQVEEDQKQASRILDSIYPIRIEDVSDLRNPGSIGHRDVQASILIHNFGLSNLCLAQVSESFQRHTKLQQAIYLFQLADDILEQTCNDLEDEIDLRQIACVNMAVLTALLQALSWDKQFVDHAKFVNDRLVYLGSAVQEIDEVLGWYTENNPAAAAA